MTSCGGIEYHSFQYLSEEEMDYIVNDMDKKTRDAFGQKLMNREAELEKKAEIGKAFARKAPNYKGWNCSYVENTNEYTGSNLSVSRTRGIYADSEEELYRKIDKFNSSPGILKGIYKAVGGL